MIYVYKIPKVLKQTLAKSKIEVNYISEISSLYEFSVFITSIENITDNKSVFTDDLLKNNIKIIAVFTSKTTEQEKSIAYMNGAVAFLHENAGTIEIKTLIKIFPNLKNNINTGNLMLTNNILNEIPLPIFMKDQSGIFIACNKQFCEYVGYERDYIIGKTTEHFTSNKKTQIYDEIDKIVMQTGKTKRHESKIINADKSVLYSLIHKSALFNDKGEVSGIIGVITDITHKKQKQTELKKEKIKAKTSDKLKTSFLSNMSHEIRTPMNAIVGFSQLLAMPNLKNDKKKIYIDQINANSEQLLNLIEDIIEVSRIEAGKIKIKKTDCFINEQLDKIKLSFEAHKARLGKNHVKLILNKENKNPEYSILTDTYRINQILSNLLSNSVKFTERGYIEFGYNILKDKKLIEFYVNDTGQGINKDKIKYVFDRFSKVPASKTKLYAGTGIGLSISRSLTELLGGEIKVESEEGVGTKFTFTIPLIETSGKSEHKKEKMPEIKSKSYNWKDKTILIAEDEEMNFLYLQEVLRGTNVKILWRLTGKDAVDEVSSNNDISLILMDVRMPKMDGVEATKILKQKMPQLPIIIQTAYALKTEKEKGFKAGCDEYLEKPVKQDELLAVIEKYI